MTEKLADSPHYLAGLKASDAVFAERAFLNSQSGLTVNAGVMHCPICKDHMLMWQVLPNGHLRMKCAGPDCVQWIE